MEEKDKAELLKSFMKEFFPYAEFKRAGIFTKEMRGDYKAQADWVCNHFGYKTVYEYGAQEIRCHITHSGPKLSVNNEGELEHEPFVTVKKSIYE